MVFYVKVRVGKSVKCGQTPNNIQLEPPNEQPPDRHRHKPQ